MVELADIVFNGRDFNVCLWADLQSFFLKAIGMEADSNSRQNFNLLGLGNYYTDEFGCVNDSYGVLSNMISNRYMVENKDTRTRLIAEFNALKPISKQNERPILLSTLEPPSVCLQADVRHYQNTSSNDVPDTQTHPPSGTIEQDQQTAGNPYGKGVDDVGSFLVQVLSETLSPVFSEEFPLKEHDQRVRLAKLVIAQNLGKEKTIFLLWGARPGGRNHHLYTDAREMLEKLINGENNG